MPIHKEISEVIQCYLRDSSHSFLQLVYNRIVGDFTGENENKKKK